MTESEYARAGEILDAALSLSPDQRAAAVEAACGGDAELQRIVARLLRADELASSTAFLGSTGAHQVARMLAEQSPEPGAVLGHFRLGERIGSGGMGFVHAAEDLNLNRRVAVKLLARGFAQFDSDRRQRFEREARAAAGLNHPNIASVHYAGFHAGWSYIAMEFIEGRTLRSLLIESGPLEYARLVDIISQAAAGLGHAHQAGITHNDVKPENIMVRADGIVKIVDFGLAFARDNLRHTTCGEVAGTIRYVAPEQIRGGAPPTPGSDVFSLGIVSYEMATGGSPFQGATDREVLDAILQHNPVPPSKLRPELNAAFDAFAEKALAKNPDDRYPSAVDMRLACAALSRKTGRLWMRRLALMAAVAALLALAVSYFAPSLRPPRVTGIQQLTKSRAPVEYFVTNGTQVYFAAGPQTPGSHMYQMNVNGGEPIPLPQWDGMFPMDISPDGKRLVLGRFSAVSGLGPYDLYTAPIAGGPPQSLNQLRGKFAHWSPKGDRILYSEYNSLKIAQDGGSNAHEIAHSDGYIEDGAWSPDGSTLRITVSYPNARRILQVNPDGSDLKTWAAAQSQPWREMGTWTPRNHFFVYSAGKGSHDLWLTGEGRSPFRSWESEPFRLTDGPFWAYQPRASVDGRRIYFLGKSSFAELVRFDPDLQEWRPYLGGIDAVQLNYSPDRQMIAYADSNGHIWRARSDGSGHVELTRGPLFARNPRWKPGGRDIAFYAGVVGQPDSLYLVNSDTGKLTRLTHGEDGLSEGDPSWSPDGSAILYGVTSREDGHKPSVFRLEMKTLQSEAVPGTQGLWSPRWSPDGYNVAALDPSAHLAVYNLQTRSTRVLTDFGSGYPMWSSDGRYIYFENNSSSNWYRVSVEGGSVETILKLDGLRTALNGAGWVAAMPDGQVISARAVSLSNLYALDWDN